VQLNSKLSVRCCRCRVDSKRLVTTVMSLKGFSNRIIYRPATRVIERKGPNLLRIWCSIALLSTCLERRWLKTSLIDFVVWNAHAHVCTRN